ncbi:hypothetical protein, partial [Mangrovicoccus algicola]
MKAGLALVLAGLGLAGCSAWQGGTTALTPAGVADAALVPAAPEGTAPVLPVARAGSTGSAGATGTEALRPVSAGTHPMTASAAPAAVLQPSVPEGSTGLVPQAPAGSTALEM